MVRHSGLLHKTVDLLSDLRAEPSHRDPALRTSIVRGLLAVDGELVNWLKDLSPDRIRVESPELLATQPSYVKSLAALPGAPERFLMYDDLQVLYVWNLCRGNRIAIHCSVIRAEGAHKGPDQALYRQQRSISIVRELFEDICASVYATFLVYSEGRAPATNTTEINGLRQIFLLGPLLTAAGYVQSLPISPVPKERLIWLLQVIKFLRLITHVGRNG